MYTEITILMLSSLCASIRRKEFTMENTIYCLQETHIKYKNSETLKVKGWKKYVM